MITEKVDFTYDAVTGYVVARGNMAKGHFNTFAEAVAHAREGDHIHLISGTGTSTIHNFYCTHPGCKGMIAPFPEALCSECRSY